MLIPENKNTIKLTINITLKYFLILIPLFFNFLIFATSTN
jgi:hypothetical protein